MGRAPCCDKANVKKGPWSPEEDAKLKSYIEQRGTGGNWIALPQKIGLKRCGKSCRLRWLNYLRPNIKHGGFSEEEDNLICSLYISIGSRWSIIASQLPGRTDNDVKNYWNKRLKKKLLGKQRKEKHGRSTREPARNSGGLIGQHPVAQLPPLLPPITYSNEVPRFSDHSSIRKLSIEVGGKFSTVDQIDGEQINLLHPAMEEPLIQPVYNYSIDSISNSEQYIPLLNPMFWAQSLPSAPHLDMAELERVMYENPEKLQGLEFFYDDVIDGGESTGMNPMIFAASGSDNDRGFLRGSTEGFAADEIMRFPGTQ